MGSYSTPSECLTCIATFPRGDRTARFRFGPVLGAILAFAAAWFRSRTALQLEIFALRHQMCVLQRSVKRPKLTTADRRLWAWLCSV